VPVQVSLPPGRPDPRLPDNEIYSLIEPGQYGWEREGESGLVSDLIIAFQIHEGKNDPQK
jgi:hypothetical protein